MYESQVFFLQVENSELVQPISCCTIVWVRCVCVSASEVFECELVCKIVDRSLYFHEKHEKINFKLYVQ